MFLCLLSRFAVVKFTVYFVLCLIVGRAECMNYAKRQIEEGTDAIVDCNVAVTPDTDIYWSKADHVDVFRNGPKLHFRNMQRSDSGDYECHSVNTSNPKDNQTVEMVTIDVTYPATITGFSVDPISPLENSSAVIFCALDGNPNPAWELRNNWTKHVLFRGNTSGQTYLTFKAECGQSGPYMCTGYNALNRGFNATRQQNVSVRCAPRPKPNAPGDYIVNSFVGIPVLFFENVIGYPHPNYTWSRADGQPMGESEQYSFPSVAALNLTKPKVSDFGQYILNMTNGYGSHTSVFDLVQYRPATIPVFSVTPVNPTENSSVRIICDMEGNPEPVWELRNDRTGELFHRSNRSGYLDLTIKTIECGQSGTYVCTGYNQLNHGINATKEQKVTVQCAPRPTTIAPDKGTGNTLSVIIASSAGGAALIAVVAALLVAYRVRVRGNATLSSKTKLIN